MTQTIAPSGDWIRNQPHQWARIVDLVQESSGVDLTLYKESHLARRTSRLMEVHHIHGLTELAGFLTESEAHLRWFVDGLSVNVTELFRDPRKWTELVDRILPDLVADRQGLSCWSAGCSIGAEAYSLAILLDMHFPAEHTILATDIDEAALTLARRGEFAAAEMRCVEPGVRSKYFFYRYSTDTWIADPALHAGLHFMSANLLADDYGDDLDLIICRNVAIYMTDEAQDHIFRRFFKALRPGGVLFTGSTEPILNAQLLGYESPVPSFYRKPI